jgi:hypothetical protein
LEQCGIGYVDLTTMEESHRFAEAGRHWTPEGHRFVCEKIEPFLARNHYLESASSPARH